MTSEPPTEPIGAFEPLETHPKRKPFTVIQLGIVVGLAVLLGVVLVPNFMRARARGELTACKSNLKNLATAMDMYARDNKGVFPNDCNQLIQGHYLKVIPNCPSLANRHTLQHWGSPDPCLDPYSYEVRHQPESFTMTCKGNHKDAYTGFAADSRGYPQYNAEQGLLDHP